MDDDPLDFACDEMLTEEDGTRTGDVNESFV